MSYNAIIVLIGVAAMLLVLVLDKMRPGLTLFCAAVFFMAMGIISPEEVAAGFSNRAMITVAVLFLISEGVRHSGALSFITSLILPKRERSVPLSLARIVPSVAAISAFLNNTAVVILFAPIIKRWAEKKNLPATKFLIPLSYATIMGGMCSLIGTSTNLVVHGMMIDSGYRGFSMFELGQIGIVITVVGTIYLVVFGNTLLPGSRILKKNLDDLAPKEYCYDVAISSGSKLIGQKIRRNKFEAIPSVDVRAVKRGGEIILVDGKTLDIEEGDTLVLAGKSDAIELILTQSGLELECLMGSTKEFAKRALNQVEVVIGPRFPGIGKSLKEFNFYRHYGQVVMSIHRNGDKVTSGLDSHILLEGDTLVLITDGTFIETWGESSAFYMVSYAGDFKMPNKGFKKWLSIALLLFMILGATFSQQISALAGVNCDMFFFAAITMALMAATKLFRARKYTKYITWDILIAIASAFAISKALINSSIDDSIAWFITEVSQNFGAHGALFSLYLITMILTELITNNAAVAIGFPIATAVAARLGVDPMPFFVAICVAASASFSSPIGYQTNLIVQGVGGYKFKDYLRIGIPLSFIILAVSTLLIPLIWNF